jgi:hypothetical protein
MKSKHDMQGMHEDLKSISLPDLPAKLETSSEGLDNAETLRLSVSSLSGEGWIQLFREMLRNTGDATGLLPGNSVTGSRQVLNKERRKP